MEQYTPMIQQYLKIKSEYQDAFLFFRLGDFYEMFFEDAIQASQLLEITLTSRDGGTKDKIPMCGVPYHSAQGYIEQLIEKGYKVAICEQTEDPKQAKGVVRREVVQLISPGTLMEGKGLHEKENNFIATVSSLNDSEYGLAYIDLSTGESQVTTLGGSLELLINEIATIGTKEIVTSAEFPSEQLNQIKARCQVILSYEDNTVFSDEFSTVLQNIKEPNLQTTALRLLHYLKRTQKRNLDHLQPFSDYKINHYMKIDYFSKRNLELIESIRGRSKKGTLLWLLDETVTAMGGRLLKHWIDRPLIHQNQIEQRLEMVDVLISQYFDRHDIREKLREVYDLERLSGRVAFGNATARDLLQLKKSLTQIPSLIDLTKNLDSKQAKELAKKLDPCEDLIALLDKAIMDNPPLTIKEGDIIKDGFHEGLDMYRDASRNGKDWIVKLEQQERTTTGIKSLKIGYNRVFGYFIEVTRANAHLLDNTRYERKQTLANAERFITPELKEKEALILEANEKSIELEYQLFMEIRETVKNYIPRIQQTAKVVSELDVYQCFAMISEKRHYVKPSFNTDRNLSIIEGRHPVVEKVMDAQSYVPNDCNMDETREILLITGPNMSGKSTYMRQIALISIMAQIGCYVPAEKVNIPIFDQIFTRIGAADDLISGQSTFMVEMLEAKNAITHATENSLILFDEIGRGTSTYDGMALAQAIIEYIHHYIKAKTLFSTHYHELTSLEEELDQLKNVHVSAQEEQGKLVFLHKVKDGAADKSYGIHVAELAELPGEVIRRANELLLEFEQPNKDSRTSLKVEDSASVNEQLALFSHQEEKPKEQPQYRKIIKKLNSINVLEMNPMQAMNTLYELQKELKS